jgi:CubicO group peptidase (beta-lactamase class C family)
MKRILLKLVRYTLFTLLALFITANAIIILSGRFYLYKGIANTYLVGRKGPSIYDKDIFYNDTLHHADAIDEFVLHPSYNKIKISKEDRKFLEDYGSRALLVLKGDTLIHEEYWDTHDAETVSNSFSVAKTITACLVAIAIEEGHINSLDTRVSTFVPEFKTGDRAKITIRHLMQMASGLDWHESGENPFSDNAESYYGIDLYGQVTRQRLVEEPGKRFNYQSGNSQLLSFVLKKATGKSVSQYAEEKIWSKIGTSADAYWNLDKKDGDEKAFCCFYSNARDYARLGLLFLIEGKYKDEQIIPKWFYDEMIKPAPISTEEGIENYKYGLHVWLYLGGEEPVYYCRGIKGQYLITIPSRNLLIVRMGTDRTGKVQIPEDKLDDAEYIEKNKYQIDQPSGLFQYISLAKSIESQIKN